MAPVHRPAGAGESLGAQHGQGEKYRRHEAVGPDLLEEVGGGDPQRQRPPHRECGRGLGPCDRASVDEGDLQARRADAPPPRHGGHPVPRRLRLLHHDENGEPSLPPRGLHQSHHHQLHGDVVGFGGPARGRGHRQRAPRLSGAAPGARGPDRGGQENAGRPRTAHPAALGRGGGRCAQGRQLERHPRPVEEDGHRVRGADEARGSGHGRDRWGPRDLAARGHARLLVILRGRGLRQDRPDVPIQLGILRVAVPEVPSRL
mmetsp:Transcript_59676/g.172884  ORF Transcript_59676/g.172884 Transcript_59676/m.172884 type:complete len:260 (+) Transcript_59676:996-1775(+)